MTTAREYRYEAVTFAPDETVEIPETAECVNMEKWSGKGLVTVRYLVPLAPEQEDEP